MDEMGLYLGLVDSSIVLLLSWKNQPNPWKTFSNHRIILSPLNALLILCSKEKFLDLLFRINTLVTWNS